MLYLCTGSGILSLKLFTKEDGHVLLTILFCYSSGVVPIKVRELYLNSTGYVPYFVL